MAIKDRVTEWVAGDQLAALREAADQQEATAALLAESLQALEMELQAEGWRRLIIQSEHEFTRTGLRDITELARIMKLVNPLIFRGVTLKRLYTWANGVSIRARQPEINEVVQAFLDDERNQASLTGHQARGEAEESLQSDGNLFLRFFINGVTGRVRVALVDTQEISAIIANPEDAKEAYFYKRIYQKTALDGKTETVEAYYPDWRYLPKQRGAGLPPGMLEKVDWNTPMFHVAVNRVGQWGVCEYYSGMRWALAYKSFLENLATVWQALARFAWQLTTKGGKRGVAAAKTKLGTRLGAAGVADGNPPPLTGSTFISGEDVSMAPMKTAGATMQADDGRRLFLMAAAAMGFPETFYGDTSVGTLATAKALDRPTELMITDRQTLWADVFRGVLKFVVTQAVKAPQGALSALASVQREDDGDQWLESLVWQEMVDEEGNPAPINPTVDIDFPGIVEQDVPQQIDALVKVATLGGSQPAGTLDLETFTRLAATMLGIPDVDALVERLFAEQEEDEDQEKDEKEEEEEGEEGEDSAEEEDEEENEEEGEEEEEDEEESRSREAVLTAVRDLLVELRETLLNGDHTAASG